MSLSCHYRYTSLSKVDLRTPPENVTLPTYSLSLKDVFMQLSLAPERVVAIFRVNMCPFEMMR